MGKVTVQLYGAFRRFGNGRSIEVSINEPVTVSQLRNKMLASLREVAPQFKEEGLLADSAFADAKSLLGETSMVSEGDTLAILPPVCGG